MSVSWCAATAGTVLLINTILTVCAATKYGLDDGLATIQEGSCRRTKDLSLWLHLLINALSTVLLSASNYCMQCLTSPTREEVDQAHRNHSWVDIGVSGVRNLTQISWYKVALWWLLALSGIPLHLLYNSAVFSTLAANEYSVFAVSSEYLASNNVNWTSWIEGSSNSLQDFQFSTQQRLENTQCIQAYGQTFVSSHGNVMAVTSDLNVSQPVFEVAQFAIQGGAGSSGVPYYWICQSTDKSHDSSNCNINGVLRNPESWTLENVTSGWDDTQVYNNVTVDYCLSTPIEERCRLQFSLPIMAIVIGCNLVKMICMLLSLWVHKSQPLVTLGDAIKSFLQHRDSTTENMCLPTRLKFMNNDWSSGARTWHTERHRWFTAASARRWISCNVL